MTIRKSHMLAALVGLLMWIGLYTLAFGEEQECTGLDDSPCNVWIVNGQVCADEATRDPDDDCFIPITCAECRTDAECDTLCEVGPCQDKEQIGCWMPEGL